MNACRFVSETLPEWSGLSESSDAGLSGLPKGTGQPDKTGAPEICRPQGE
jgi:hypothetical protein